MGILRENFSRTYGVEVTWLALAIRWVSNHCQKEIISVFIFIFFLSFHPCAVVQEMICIKPLGREEC